MKVAKLYVVAFALGALLLPGCGGGGGSPVYSGGNGSGGTTTPAMQLRSPRPGDTYTYNLSGQLQTVGTSSHMNYTGTLVVTYSATSYNGLAAVAENVAITFNLSNGQTVTVDSQVIQSLDSNGDLLDLATIQNGFTDGFNPPTVDEPAKWGNGFALNQQTTTDTGTSYSFSFVVSGSETVSSPVGTFACWKVNYSQNSTSSQNVNLTEWFAPEMGPRPIKFSGTSTLMGTDGNTYTVTCNAIMVSTNVPVS